MAELNSRIDAISKELQGSKVGNSSSSAKCSEARLVKTVAAQVTRLLASGVQGPEGISGAEHLAGVVDYALEMSGKAKEPVERSRLLMEVGKALSNDAKNRGAIELRVHCFVKATDTLDDAAEATRGSRALTELARLRGEALSLAADAFSRLGEEGAAEASLQEAVKSLGKYSSKDEECSRLVASAHKMLAEVCSHGKERQKDTEKHLEAAEQLLSDISVQRSEAQAEASLGFAVPAGAERIPLRKYSFSDGSRHCSIRIDLDEALYDGASQLITNQCRHLKVNFDEGSNTVLELHIAAPKTKPLDTHIPDASRACWVLRLAPLYRPVVAEATEVKLRRGVVELRLTKQESSPWYEGAEKK
eukprot:TRINITY_DN5164_c0_g5_i1.p1 TRINITY_DN5164_c0_g5~~TRINITY_DN5164_c0_g5_i1.p1  ORF type:complete len:396 (-),score=94.47 TRINITY_DN5164_c0_g5_i1:802-1884(-)